MLKYEHPPGDLSDDSALKSEHSEPGHEISTPASGEIRVKQPKRAEANPQFPSERDRYTTFHQFADLPTEIRLKIWGLTLHIPQVLTITHDTSTTGHKPYRQYRPYPGRTGEWKITKDIKVAARTICQESRSESAKSDHEIIRLDRDVTQRSWFNFAIDTIFLTTNARFIEPEEEEEEAADNAVIPLDLSGSYDPTRGVSKQGSSYLEELSDVSGTDILQKARVHAKDSLYRYGPDFFPVSQIINRQPAISIDRGLWLHWNFRDRDGSDVTCSGCAGNGIEVGQVKWMQIVMRATQNLSKVYLVSNMSIWEDLGDNDFTFKNDIDPPNFVVFPSYHWANSRYPIPKDRLAAFRAKVKWLQIVEAEPKEVINKTNTIKEGDTEDVIAADVTTGRVECVDTVSKFVDGSQMTWYDFRNLRKWICCFS